MESSSSRSLDFIILRRALLIMIVWTVVNSINFAAAANNIKNDCNFPAVFNFGDSNSDTGGALALFGQATWPNGQTFFHTPSARFSDGRLIIDFAAESLGIPYLSAYLESVGSNFSSGANFATAGATIRPHESLQTVGGVSPVSLNVQVIQFSEFLNRSQTVRDRGGVFSQLLPAADYFCRALYTFDVGQNDLTAGLKLNLTAEQIKTYVPDLLDRLSEAIKKVHDDGGARSIWVHNTGPLGCLPYSMVMFPVGAAQTDRYGCAIPYNQVAQFYNQRLKEAVVQLREELPLAAITYVDVYAAKYLLISQAKDQGFEDPMLACCGQGGGRYNFNDSKRCGAKIKVIGKEVGIVGSCANPKVRISWDGIHYTEAANKWVFGRIVNGNFSDPPVALNSACHSH